MPDDLYTIYNHTTTHLSWMNRIRVLFGRPVKLSITITVAGIPELHDGEVQTTCATVVPPIFPKREKPMGIGAEAVHEEPTRQCPIGGDHGFARCALRDGHDGDHDIKPYDPFGAKQEGPDA